MLAVLGVAVILGGAWLWTPDKDRAQLEARYAGAQSTFVSAAGLRVHVRDSGPLDKSKDAPVVILLHGFGSSLHTWDDWARGLSSKHRVIRFDLPGSGLTGADPTGDYSDARSLQVLGALMDALGVTRASLVGHSMGGRIAALVRLMQYVLPRPVLRMSLAPAYANPSVMTDELVTRYYDMMLAPTVRTALIARMEQSVLQDPVPILQRIKAPTLLLWGDADAMIPIANAADYLRALPDARLVTLPRVGHIPQEEAPDAALAVVEKFLDEDLRDQSMRND